MTLPLARRIAVGFAVLSTVGTAAASAQDDQPRTVSRLLSLGYKVVSTFMTPVGPALFLQGSQLYFCVVEEKPDTATLTTLYCKIVE